ncbi:MAG: YciI family protein [Caulobacteraceae bacterium]|nr:YciI family protein [Caulobacteraceae bacterium]
MNVTYFAFRGYDGPRSSELRSRVREQHRAYIREERYGCRVIAGGAIVDDDGRRMTGTLLILEAPDRAAALRFLAGDPYACEGLFERTELDRWQWGLGQPS